MENNIENPVVKELQQLKAIMTKILGKLPKASTKENEYVNIGEASKILKRSPATIRRWIYDNKLEGIKLNKGSKQDRYLVPMESIDEIIKRSHIA